MPVNKTKSGKLVTPFVDGMVTIKFPSGKIVYATPVKKLAAMCAACEGGDCEVHAGGIGSGRHPEGTLYHGTTKTNANVIQREGLKMPNKGIYVTSDKDYASRAAKDKAKETNDTPVVVVLKPSANKYFDSGKTEFGDSKLHQSSKKKLDAKHIDKVIEAGGPGSGCHGDNCGRPSGERVYVSPNGRQNTKLPYALKMLKSDKQKVFEKKASDTVKALAHDGTVRGAVGVWKDGAENSTSIWLHAKPETSRYVAALLGKAANQKAVLNWTPNPDGKHTLYTISSDHHNIKEMHDVLAKTGIDYHTLTSGKQNTAVVLDTDNSMGQAIGKLSKENGYETTRRHGTGEFIGSNNSREAGIKAYSKIIQAFEHKHPEKAYSGHLGLAASSVQDRTLPSIDRRLAEKIVSLITDAMEAGGPGSGRTPEGKEALDNFMKEHWKNTYGNPFDDHERVWKDKAAMEIYPFDGKIHLSAIRTFEKGKGDASKALDYLHQLADKHNVAIDLDPKPFGKGGLNKKQLTAWYGRHGYEKVKGTGGQMVRQPKPDVKAGGVGSGRHGHYGFTSLKEARKAMDRNEAKFRKDSTAQVFRRSDDRLDVHFADGTSHHCAISPRTSGHYVTKEWTENKIAAGGPGSGPHSKKAFRDELNKSGYQHSHANNRFGNRKRAYGDYLYHQDRDKFEIDYAEWLAEKKKSLKAGGPGSGRHPWGRKSKPQFLQKHNEHNTQYMRAYHKKLYDAYKAQGLNSHGKRLVSAKQKLAAKNTFIPDIKVHQKAEEVEHKVTTALGGIQQHNNSAADVTVKVNGKLVGLEVKTLLAQKNDKLTMKKDSLVRKQLWMQTNKAMMGTVAVDIRGGGEKVYYRPGVGSFRVSAMKEVPGGYKGLAAAIGGN